MQKRLQREHSTVSRKMRELNNPASEKIYNKYTEREDSYYEIYLYFNSFDIPSQIKKDFNDKTNVSTKNLVAKIFPLTD